MNTSDTARQAPLSLLQGNDTAALERLLDVHGGLAPIILDVTHNQGTMWRGCRYQPAWKSDLEGGVVDVWADFTNLPFADRSMDCIVFDPPHLPNHAATAGSSGMWRERYGIRAGEPLRDGDNVSQLFAPFLVEAHRVLRAGGIILAKIADITHNHRYQWQHVDFVCAVRELGMTPCDCLIKADPRQGNLKSSRWRNVHHLRKAHSYWIVVRNSKKCERRPLTTG
jgi:SAM-dependent methyltransferase